MHSFFGKSQSHSALIFGAPESFVFENWLSEADLICAALAFGHMSGWSRIKSAIMSSKAKNIRILLGQAFFQTEPKLLLELKQLQASMHGFQAKLASSITTFHSKLWIVRSHEASQTLIGSSNLSNGGFSTNVECNLYTNEPPVIRDVEQWFCDQWDLAHELDSNFFEKYMGEYEKIKNQRDFLNTKIAQSQESLGREEEKWRKKDALDKAHKFWESYKGINDTRDREEAIEKMRRFLNYPTFEFTEDGYDRFVRIAEFGRIRLAHLEGTKAHLHELKAALKQVGKKSANASFDDLSAVYGIGPNLTTKLLAISDPHKFVVVNEPVEKALLSFGFGQENLDSLNGTRYVELLTKLDPFIDQAHKLQITPASGLDAFFYFYRGNNVAKP